MDVSELERGLVPYRVYIAGDHQPRPVWERDEFVPMPENEARHVVLQLVVA